MKKLSRVILLDPERFCDLAKTSLVEYTKPKDVGLKLGAVSREGRERPQGDFLQLIFREQALSTGGRIHKQQARISRAPGESRRASRFPLEIIQPNRASDHK
jgi:hypothetical protein